MTAFGPGKVILLGEHAVVYGYAAVAGPLSQGMTARAKPADRCELKVPKGISKHHRQALQRAFERAAQNAGAPCVKVELQSDLPLSMGLGSSAALSVAVAKVLLEAADRAVTPKNVLALAAEMEQEFHGTPSGVDHTTSARNELLLFRRKPGAPNGTAKVLECPKPLHVLVALCGERPPTRATVSGLRERRERWPRRYERLFTEIGRVAEEGAEAIREGDLEALGDAMNVNQGLLAALGLSSPAIEGLLATLRRAGALGAKLTGAGGDGGALIGLFRDPRAAARALARQNIHCFTSQLAGPGGPQEANR